MSWIRVLTAIAVLSAIVVSVGSTPAQAATVTTPIGCGIGVPPQTGGLNIPSSATAAGTAAPLAGTAPGGVGFDLVSMQGTIDLDTSIYDELWLVLARQGLLSPGPTTVVMNIVGDIAASNTLETVQTFSSSEIFTVTIFDPDGISGNGDELLVEPTPSMAVQAPSSLWTPTGGTIEFSYSSNTVGFDGISALGSPFTLCEPGIASDCSPPQPWLSSLLDCATFAPQAALPFASLAPSSSPGVSGTVTCIQSATGAPIDAVLAFSGAGVPNPVSRGADTLALTGTAIDLLSPSTNVLAGYLLGIGVIGLNAVAIEIQPTILAIGTDEPAQTLPVATATGTFTITDPDGTPGTGDETATPLTASIPVSDSTWTPNAGTVQFSSGGAEVTLTYTQQGGPFVLNVSCQTGYSTPLGCDSLTVVCSGQLFVPEGPFATVGVLENICNSSLGACAIEQIITQVVVGVALTAEQPGSNILLSAATLDGTPQVVSGSIHPVTVTNARGDLTGWTLSGYVTDFGAPGAPMVDPDGAGPALPVPDCGSLGGPADARCIPGDNFAWNPTAAVTHALIAGDVAVIAPGPAISTDASTWLNEHIAGTASDGLGGLGEINVLCGATASQSGGTFVCGANLFLAIPASAAAANYTAVLVLTLL